MKAFNYLLNALIIAKLDEYGFDNISFILVHIYLSIFDPVIFNISIGNLFIFTEKNAIGNYANDNAV